MDKKGRVPVFPNNFPYNDLLLQGKLLAKTRDWYWDYRGPVLLYTSSHNAVDVARDYQMRPKDYAHKMIIGRGNLVDCRVLSDVERMTILRQFNPMVSEERLANPLWLIQPMHFGFFFEDLVRFPQPVAIDWPAGAVRPIWMPMLAVAGLLTSPPDSSIKSLSYASTRVVKPKRKEIWAELTDVKIASLKDLGRYKIRFDNDYEVTAYWDQTERCFVYNNGEDGAYVDEPDRPTHIRVGFQK